MKGIWDTEQTVAQFFNSMMDVGDETLVLNETDLPDGRRSTTLGCRTACAPSIPRVLTFPCVKKERFIGTKPKVQKEKVIMLAAQLCRRMLSDPLVAFASPLGRLALILL
jgi:hypothetical protein